MNSKNWGKNELLGSRWPYELIVLDLRKMSHLNFIIHL